MNRSYAVGLVALAGVLSWAGCARPAAPLSVAIVPPTASAKAFITVTGFSSSELASLKSASFNHDQWLAFMRVTVDGPDATNPPVAGQHRVTSTSVDFVPAFPFDPGRGYAVEIDPSKAPSFAEASASAEASADKPEGKRAAQSFRTVVVMPMSR